MLGIRNVGPGSGKRADGKAELGVGLMSGSLCGQSKHDLFKLQKDCFFQKPGVCVCVCVTGFATFFRRVIL